MANLGSMYLDLQRYEDAERLLDAATELAKRRLKSGHWHIGYFQVKHGNALIYLNRYEEAEASLLEGRANLVAALGEKDARVIATNRLLAILYARWNRPDEAKRWKAEEASTSQPAS
jgi:Uri superfamily endonuclease